MTAPALNTWLMPSSRQGWSHTVYGDSLTSGLPPNMLEPGGLGFLLSTYVDSYHAGNTITRCSQTGFLVYCNSALIYWISKKKIPMKNHLLVVSFVQWKLQPNISGDWDLYWGWCASHAQNLPTFMGTISWYLQTRQCPTLSWRRSITPSHFTLSEKEVRRMNGGRLMLIQMKTHWMWWPSPSLQGRGVKSLLVCFCTISKIRWFVGGLEVRLHLNHSVF